MDHIRRVNLDEYDSKVDTVWLSPVNLVGQDSTKRVNSTISSLLQFTVNMDFQERDIMYAVHTYPLQFSNRYERNTYYTPGL